MKLSVGLLLAAVIGGSASCGADLVDSDAEDLTLAATADLVSVDGTRLIYPHSAIRAVSVLRNGETRKLTDLLDEVGREGAEPVYLVELRAKSAVKGNGEIDSASRNPFGFMKKALSYTEEDSNIVIETTDATLDEVLGDISEFGTVELEQQLGAAAASSPSEKLSLTFSDSESIWSDSASGSSVALGGTIKMKFSIEKDVKKEHGKLQTAKFVLHGSVDTSLSTSFNIAFASLESVEEGVTGSTQEKALWTQYFPAGSIGPVPLNFKLQLVGSCSVSTKAGIVTNPGIKSSFEFIGGMEFKRDEQGKGKWGLVKKEPMPVSDADPAFKHTPFVDASLKCGIRPVGSLLVGTVLGPSASVEVYEKLETEIVPEPSASLSVGVAGKIGVQLEFLTRAVANASFPLFDKSAVVWKSNPSDLAEKSSPAQE